MQNPLVEELFDVVEPLGRLHSRRMFGGFGLYCDDVFFGLVAMDLLFFKVDDENRGDYLAHDARPFLPGVESPSEEARGKASYYEVPCEIQERRSEFLKWARAALAAAQRGRAKKTSVRKRAAKHKDPSVESIRRLRNLGPVSSAWLKSVGILTRGDLENAGAVVAYVRTVEAGLSPNLNFLYALEGALMDLEITRLPSELKASLRSRVESAVRRKKA
jgi:DNA transformation protein